MPRPKPTTESQDVHELGDVVVGLVNQMRRDNVRIQLEHDGKPVAVLISAREWERIQELYRRRDEQFAILNEIQAAFAGVSEEEIERETAKALAEVRAEMRAERQQSLVTR